MYRIARSKARQQWSGNSRQDELVASQTCRGTGRSCGVLLLAGSAIGALTLISALPAASVYALPTGPTLMGGTASFTQPNPATLNINQSSTKIIVNWGGFDIASGETVRYFQPGSDSIALNRVIGGGASFINGQLSGNGQVWVINGNGMLFGPNASVNTGGFLATTMSISDADFLAGDYAFSGSHGSLSQIVNQGNIQVADGGYVALAAPSVTNKGSIVANLGKIHLASGDAMTVTFAGNDLVGLVLPASASGDATGVTNSGAIKADGGQVVLSANVATAFFKAAVNNSGVIEAKTIADRNGAIVLDGGGAGAVYGGALDASASNAGEAAGSVSLTSAKDLVLGNTRAGSLDLTSGGNVTQTDVLTVSGTTRVTVTAPRANVELDRANDLAGLVTIGSSVPGYLDYVSLHNVNGEATFSIPNQLQTLDLYFTRAAINLPAETITGRLTVTAGRGVTQTGPLKVAGTTTIYAGKDIALTDAGNLFGGLVYADAENVSLRSAGDLNAQVRAALGFATVEAAGNVKVGGSVAGDLKVASGGDVAQGRSLSAATAEITAAGDIALADAGNDFRSSVSTTGGKVSLADRNDLNALVSSSGDATLKAGGDLVLTGSVGGSLTTSGASTTFGATRVGGDLSAEGGTVAQKDSLAVAGATRITSSGSIDLSDSGNDFGGPVTAAGTEIELAAKNDLTANVTAQGAASLSANGNLKVSGSTGTDLKVTGGGDVSVSASTGGNLDVSGAGNLDFGQTKVGGALTAVAGAKVSQSGALTVVQNASVCGGDIDLDDAGNDFKGAVTAIGKNITLADANDLDAAVVSLGGGAACLSAGRDLTLSGLVEGGLTAQSGGNLAQDGTLQVGGASALSAAGDVTLENAANSFGGRVTAAGKDIDLAAANDLDAAVTATGKAALESKGNLAVSGSTGAALGATSGGSTSFGTTSVGGDLAADARGDVTQTGAVAVTGSSAITSTGDINLGNGANEFRGVVTAQGRDVTLADSSDLSVQLTAAGSGALSAGGNIALGKSLVGESLTLRSGAAITQGDAVTVKGDSDMTAAGDITLGDTRNDFAGLVALSGNNIWLSDSNDLAARLGATGSAAVAAGGSLTVSGSTGGNLATKSGGGTAFGFAGKGASGKIAFPGSAGTTVGGKLAASAGGDVTQNLAVTVAGTTDIVSNGEVILNNGGNDFGGTVTARANTIRIADRNDLRVDLAAREIQVNAGGNVSGGAIALVKNSVAADTIGSLFDPYFMAGPSDGLTIYTTTWRPMVTAYLDGPFAPSQPRTTFTREGVIKWNGRVFGGNQDYALIEETQRWFADFATKTERRQALERLLLASNADSFYEPVPKPAIEYVDGAAPGKAGLPSLDQPKVEKQAGAATGKAEPAAALPRKQERAPAPVPAAPAARVTGPASAVAVVREVGHDGVKDQKFQPLAVVYFKLNSSRLDQKAKETLEQLSRSLREKGVKYTIEGFCDERGSNATNVKLGSKRARAVRAYLVSRGIDAKALSAVSYGKRFPAAPGHNEKAWKQNRRVEVVKSGAPKPGSKKRYGKKKR